MPSSTVIVIDSLIADPNTTTSEKHILHCMKNQDSLSVADVDWIAAVVKRVLLAA